MLSGMAFGQQNKTKKAPPITPPKLISPPEVKIPEYPSEDDSKKCFVYTTEEQKDSRVYVTESLLEYGWASTNARIIITTYDYDPAKKQENEDAYIFSKSLEFIEGDFKIENGKLGFMPEKSDKYQKQIFRLINKSKSKTIEYLEDEKKHQYKEGECLQPTISI